MQEDRIEKRKNTLISVTYFALIAGILFLALKYALPLLMPFIIGFSIAFILKPISKTLCKKCGLGSKFCGALVVIVGYIFIIGILFIIAGHLAQTISSFISSWEDIYSNYIAPFLNTINSGVVETASNVSSELAGQTNHFMQGLSSGIKEAIASLSQNLLMSIASFSMQIPGFIVGLFFSVISSIFISSDYTNVASFLAKLLPKERRPILFETKAYTVQTVCHYIKAYLILMGLTFVQLCICFFIIGIQNPIGTAVAISLFDAMPLLGIGFVMLPWCLILFATGNISLAISLLVIYVIIGILRGFLEPKVLGKQLGMHPLATLFAVYLGMNLMGFFGMVLFPIFMQIGICIYKSKNLKEHEPKIKSDC